MTDASWQSEQMKPRTNHRPATQVTSHLGDHGRHHVMTVSWHCDDLRLSCQNGTIHETLYETLFVPVVANAEHNLKLALRPAV